jgi:hypothetical protein
LAATSSLTVSGSISFLNLVTSSATVSNVVMYGAGGKLFVTASSAIQTAQNPSYLIYTGSVTASTSVGADTVFSITSGSSPTTLFYVSGSGLGAFSGGLIVTGSSLLSGSSTILGSLSTTGSISISGSIAISTGSFTISTGSLTVSGSINVSRSLYVGNSLTTYQQNTSVNTVGYKTVVSVATGSARAAFFDYVMYSGSANLRAGTVITVWTGSTVEYTEASTNDIGSTFGVLLVPAISGQNILLQATASSDNWTIKSLVRLL